MKVYYFIHYYINKIANFLQKIFLFLFKKIDNAFFVFKKQTQMYLTGAKNEKDVFLLSYLFVFCCLCSIVFYVTDFAKPKDFLVITEKALIKNVQVEKSMACLSCMDAYAMEIEAKPEDFLEVYLVKDISFLQDETLKDSLSASLPKQKTSLMTYTVKQGDTLSTIANKFGIDVTTLKGSNELGKVLTVGQELVILPVSGSYYTVKQGDTLSTIATKNDISINSIIEYNDIRGVEIFVGQKLILPGATATPRGNLASAGYFMQPTTGWNWGELHGKNAIDIANSCGTPVYAAASGTVTRSVATGYNGGYGGFVEIQHPNGYVTLYAHLEKVFVSVGEYIEKGESLGLMGNTGRSTGCHLHFEVHGTENPFVKN